jgi:hypothetical protein
MSDYKSVRRKKNAELQNAMSSVRKDLYDWKQAAAVLKLNREVSSASLSGRTTPQAPQPPPKLKSLDTTKLLKKTSSLKELNRTNVASTSSSSIASPSKNTTIPSPRTKIKPFGSLHSSSAKHYLDISDPEDELNFNLNENLNQTHADLDPNKKTEFLNTFKDKPPPFVAPKPQVEESNRVYLNSARSFREPPSKDPSKMAEELVIIF